MHEPPLRTERPCQFPDRVAKVSQHVLKRQMSFSDMVYTDHSYKWILVLLKRPVVVACPIRKVRNVIVVNNRAVIKASISIVETELS